MGSKERGRGGTEWYAVVRSGMQWHRVAPMGYATVRRGAKGCEGVGGVATCQVRIYEYTNVKRTTRRYVRGV